MRFTIMLTSVSWHSLSLTSYVHSKTGLQSESWKVKITSTMHSNGYFYRFLKEIWILKSGCGLRSPLQAAAHGLTIEPSDGNDFKKGQDHEGESGSVVVDESEEPQASLHTTQASFITHCPPPQLHMCMSTWVCWGTLLIMDVHANMPMTLTGSIIRRKLFREKKNWRPTCSQRIRFAQTVHQWHSFLLFSFLLFWSAMSMLLQHGHIRAFHLFIVILIIMGVLLVTSKQKWNKKSFKTVCLCYLNCWSAFAQPEKSVRKKNTWKKTLKKIIKKKRFTGNVSSLQPNNPAAVSMSGLS